MKRLSLKSVWKPGKGEWKPNRKRLLIIAVCLVAVLAGYIILTWPKKVQPEAPTVIVEPAAKGDVRYMASMWAASVPSSLLRYVPV